MVRTSYPDFRRRPWGYHALWGWRREIGAGVVTVIVLSLARAVTPLAVVVVLVGGVGTLTVRRDVRERVREQMRVASGERRLQNVFWWTDLVGRDGRLPVVRFEVPIPAGSRLVLQLPVGLHLEALEGKLGELTAALNARAVRVRALQGGARYVELLVIERDPFRDEVTSGLVGETRDRPIDLWAPIALGVGEDGSTITVQLPEHNLLIGGEPGAGKSVALSSFVAAAALDATCRISLFDGKEVELLAWRHIADHFAGSSVTDAIAVMEQLHEVLAARYRDLVEEGRRKLARDVERGLHVVVIDELGFYLRGGAKADRDRFAELLRDLIARGRAAGIIVIAATQKPSHEIVPTWIRDLFSYRLALRCTSPEASDTILGQGWASQGYNAATIDPARRGVGYLLAEGGLPVMLRCGHLSDNEVECLAARAREWRGC